MQAVAGGVALEPFCADTDSVAVGVASVSLAEWADEEAGLEAVQRVLDSLDDINALQDPFVESDVLADILQDEQLQDLLHVSELDDYEYCNV